MLAFSAAAFFIPQLKLSDGRRVGPHDTIAADIIDAMNHYDRAPDRLLRLFGEAGGEPEWCDPYPDSCHRGVSNISAFLQRMPAGTGSILLAEPMVDVGDVGGMMTTTSFSWPGNDPYCLYTADRYVSWSLAGREDSLQDSPPKINSLRWIYNATEFALAASRCLGPGAIHGSHATRVSRSRAHELEAVRDYVIGLQYSLADEALICDLLVPTARYCDPFPTSCAFGRAGCRFMKGLPNATFETPARAGSLRSEGDAAPPSRQYHCRPASVRPMMPTGPATGAVYLAYSSSERDEQGRLTHELHHTFAIWDLAPADTPQTQPAPMLSRFDWFMPARNVASRSKSVVDQEMH